MASRSELRRLAAQQRLPIGEPCAHPGCLSHISHPCGGCGRRAGGLLDESDLTPDERSESAGLGWEQCEDFHVLAPDAPLAATAEHIAELRAFVGKHADAPRYSLILDGILATARLAVTGQTLPDQRAVPGRLPEVVSDDRVGLGELWIVDPVNDSVIGKIENVSPTDVRFRAAPSSGESTHE